MSRILVLIGVVFSIIASIHYYLWARLVRDTHLPSPWAGIATIALVVLALSMPLAMVLGRSHRELGSLVAWPAFGWMGLMFLLLVSLAGVDAVRGVAWLIRRSAGSPAVDEARRIWLARLSGGAVAAFSGGLAAVAIRSATGPVAVHEVPVALANWPQSLDGLRLVQLTDIHVGTTIGRGFIEDMVRRTNELEPDLVAITGDLVDGSVAELWDAVSPLAGLRARHGVFFVTGNHEYYSGAEAWMRELPKLGIRVLRNERVAIGAGDAGFDLAGVDDHSASQHGGPSPEDALASAMSGRDPGRALILLAHQPRAFAGAVEHGVGLQLSGHTHGGQMWPFSLLVRLSQPFLAGLHREGHSQIYVSRGTGYWGPPMRLAAPAEITKVVLRRATA
jgi:predicted MPP superfamily phosphohydrolase